MTLEEQQLISRVFDRMRNAPPVAKDIAAERFIQQNIDRLPDAPYSLVQSVLVQEQALQHLSDRLQHLEDLVADARPADRNTESGASFLSSTRAAIAPAGSVPAVAPAGADPARRTDDYYREPPTPREPVASRAGGFLASALTTASGVAGGMLLTDGLREMFGGRSSAGASERGMSRGDDATTLDRFQDDAQDARLDAAEARRQLAEDDAALDEAQDALDSSGSDAGWDSSDA